MLDAAGPVQGDWVRQAKPDIEARMAQYEEDQIEFAILSLIKDPLLDLLSTLATNVKIIAALETRLDKIKPDWRRYDTSSANGGDGCLNAHLTTADASYGLEQHDIDDVNISNPASAALLSSENVVDILAFRQELILEQASVRLDIREERQSVEAEDCRAAARRRDLGAQLQQFARKVKIKEKS